MNTITLKDISYIRKLGYASGNLGFGVAFQVVIAFFYFYATVILKIPASIIGTIVSIGVIWDAITDPIMGFISDHTRSKKFGRRHLYLLVGGIGAAISNYLLWIIKPDGILIVKIIWAICALLLIKTFLTIYSTPHVALGAELSDDYDGRSTIQSTRTIFFLIGIFFVSVIFMAVFFRSTPEFPQGQFNPAAYPRMGLAASTIVIIFALITFFSTFKFIPILPKAPANIEKNTNLISKIFSDLKCAYDNKSFLAVVLGYLFTNITTGLFSGVGLHVYTYTFSFDSNKIALILGVQFFISVISQPVWLIISKKLDKKPSILLGLLSCIIGSVMLLLFVIFRNNLSSYTGLFIIFSAFIGFGSGGLFSIPLSMIADTIDIEELNTGIRSEGMFYGLLTFCYKFSQSIVLFIIGIFIEHVVKFNPHEKIQTPSTALGLGLILTIGGLISLSIAYYFYNKYTLNRNEIEIIQNKLKLKKDSLAESLIQPQESQEHLLESH